MAEAVKIIGLAKDHPIKNHVVRISVDFGPGFGSSEMTRADFIKKLRESATGRNGHFLGLMFSHFADHIEAAAHSFPGAQQYSLDAPAPLTGFNCTYGGDGSCDDCSYSHPGGSCCTCECDGTTSCEPCG